MQGNLFIDFKEFKLSREHIEIFYDWPSPYKSPLAQYFFLISDMFIDFKQLNNQ